ncbi:centromere protein L isoform X2 [Dromiciops gliroides]|uniref:centromere protein L isoform X2 n=1 Tax=Dromiciops gliroides TaxID=33562 RepID=UPI001CC4F192|nr:centromere protein L isoform X2 [Dromiciops gliroides]
MESLNVPEFTPKHRVPPRLRDYFTSASPFQRQLASVRKQTPFGQTPTRRKIPQCSPFQENIDPQKIAFLLHRQWTLYTLTPLYRFSYSNLKKYSTLLKSFLAAEKQKGLAVEMGADFNLKVIFSMLSGIKGTQGDPAAFLVQILCSKYLIGVLAFLTELAIFQIE